MCRVFPTAYDAVRTRLLGQLGETHHLVGDTQSRITSPQARDLGGAQGRENCYREHPAVALVPGRVDGGTKHHGTTRRVNRYQSHAEGGSAPHATGDGV